jgi:hypothetical protein
MLEQVMGMWHASNVLSVGIEFVVLVVRVGAEFLCVDAIAAETSLRVRCKMNGSAKLLVEFGAF